MPRQDPFQQFATREHPSMSQLELKFRDRPNEKLSIADDNQLPSEQSAKEEASSQERAGSLNEGADSLAEFDKQMSKSIVEAVDAKKKVVAAAKEKANAVRKRPASSHEPSVLKRPCKAVAPSIPSSLTPDFLSVTKCSGTETKNRPCFTSKAYHHIRKLAEKQGHNDEKSRMFGSIAGQAAGAAWDKEFRK